MGQRERLDQINVEAQLSGNRSRNLCDFNGVRQAIAEMIGVSPSEDLRFCFEAPKGTRVNHPIAVALEFIAVEVRRLGMTPPERVRNGIASEMRLIG